MSRTADIFLEESCVLTQQSLPGGHYLLRLGVHRLPGQARPGSFAQLTCDPQLPLRRPLSIMRCGEDWVEFLYKVVGRGTAALAARQPGDRVSLLGPIGNGFDLPRAPRRALLIGGGVGIPPMIFAAERLRREGVAPLVLMGSEVAFPFQPEPSRLLIDAMPPSVIATLPLLESWGIACRLASHQGFPGCFDGHVTELADAWLGGLAADARRQVTVLACGPEPMLRASASLAAHYGLPAQLCLEAHMACGVGGCAGCTVAVAEEQGTVMRRVCVDGPVFPAPAIYPQTAVCD